MFCVRVTETTKKKSSIGDAWFSYRMRWKRRRLILRSLKRRKELSRISVKTIPDHGVLAFSTMRNEMLRLEYWLKHYRSLGVGHFLIVDNNSTDGTREFLIRQPDVSLWATDHSYKASRFGVDWLTCLQFKFGHNRWCLTVDADELLTYPDRETRPLPLLTAHLDKTKQRSFGAIMVDLYPKGPISNAQYEPGTDPTSVLNWFDGDNYRGKIHPIFGNLWIQGGVRDRVFFSLEPERSPTLNKTPLVKWRRSYVYVTSTHQLLPRSLNNVFEIEAKKRISGVLLHTKFLPNIAQKSQEELVRGEHFENSALYKDYYSALAHSPNLWCENSMRFENDTQLESLGLMTRDD